MLVNLKARLGYIAVPKTASSALQNAMLWHADFVHTRTAVATHMTAGSFELFMRPYLRSIGFDDVETCAQIRHPVDWLTSWWRYLSDPKVRPPELGTRDISFARYVEAYLDGDPAPPFSIGRQASMLCNDDGALIVNHLYRYEDMTGFVAFLEKRLGTRLKLGVLNVSPERGAVLPAALRTRLEDHYAPEMALFEAAGARK